MNFRLTAILFGVVLLLVAGLLVAVLVDNTPAADATVLDLAKAKPEDIDYVEIVRTEPSEQKIVFARVNKDQWDVQQPAGPRVEGYQVSNLVADLLRLKPTPYGELPGGASEAGLDPPTMRITLRKGGEKSATLLIGDTTIGRDKAVTFVATSERPSVPVAVKRSDLSALFRSGTDAGKAWQLAKWLPDFRQKRLVGADLRDAVAELKSVKVTQGAGDKKKELSLSKSDTGEWTFAAPANYGVADIAGDPQAKPDTFTGVRPLVNFLTGLAVGGPNDFIEAPEAPDKYGLNTDDPNLIRIELVPKSGPPEVVTIGKKVDEKATPTVHYARVSGDPAVVKLQTDRLDALVKTLADPSELRDRTLVPDAKRESIDAIDVTIGAQTMRMRRVTVGAAKEWVLYGGPTDPQIAGPAAQDLIDSLTRPRVAKDVFSVPVDAAFTPPEVKAVVKLWYDGTELAKEDKKEEKKDPAALPAEPKLKGDAAVTLMFGKKEGDATFTRRTTAAGNTDLKLPEAVAAAAARGRLAYLNPSLKSFPTNNATKIVMNHGTEVFELVKDEKPDPQHPLGKWTFAKPERLKGQTADTIRIHSDILSLLATQTASGVVAESPSPEELKKLGLDPATPTMKITVTLDTKDAEKERVYLFGTPTADKQGVHAMQQGKPIVFTVAKFVHDKLATADLRDLTLYRIDPKKVKSIRFKGWKQAAGAPVEYAFERKDGGWATVQSPAPFTADPAKLDALLATLMAPKPIRSTGSGTKPEHGFDPAAKNALEITLVLEDQPTIALALGDETDNGLNYYAWCSMKKDEVMVLPAAALKLYKDKPDYLKR